MESPFRSAYMKNYILHIGLPKTGTTALQKYYFSRFKHSSLCYNPSSLLTPLGQAIKLLDFGSLKSDDTQLLKEVVKHQSQKIPQQNILISLEILSQRLLKFDFKGRGDFLKSIFPDATVVMVLRHQPALLRSLYQQQVHQNYLLSPEDVFIPFSNHTFPASERWKASMQIDVKEWNYKEAIQHFRECYGEKFRVLFFENHFKDILTIGQDILALPKSSAVEETSPSPLPQANVSYCAEAMCMVLAIARRKWAFSANHGFNSRHVQDLMEQAEQARHVFDAADIQGFLRRLEHQKRIPRSDIYSRADKQLLKLVKLYGKLHNCFKPQKYELPAPIRTYLEHESKILNASLDEVIDRQIIPKQYLG
ncbi:MAG: hypothetical protein AAGF01_29455 [Cyanobacteria bacterium P01_G01_bin.38]